MYMYMDMHVHAGPWSNHIPQGAIMSDNRKLGSHDLRNLILPKRKI